MLQPLYFIIIYQIKNNSQIGTIYCGTAEVLKDCAKLIKESFPDMHIIDVSAIGLS